MTIRQLNVEAKMAITLFLLCILFGSLASVILVSLELGGKTSGFNIPTISQIENKYTSSALVGAMRGSMYEHVSDDSDIELVSQWVENGAANDALFTKVHEIIQYDCTNCHSKSSKMTEAIPSIPFESYDEIKASTSPGYSLKEMAKQAHIHLYGISLFLILLTLLFSYTTYHILIKRSLISISFLSAFLDISSWWFSKYYHSLVYLMFVVGGLLIACILSMCILILIDIWKKST